jgi:hypothetical protein
VLVTRDPLRRRPVAAHDPEARLCPAADPVGFSLDRLAQDLGQGDPAPTRFSLEHSEVIGIGGDGGASCGHCI